MDDNVTIEVLEHLTDTDAAGIERLLPQLSSAATFDRGRIEAVAQHEATNLLVARLDGSILGMATLVIFPLPTGLRGHVEDVVVDEAFRGRGIAQKLPTLLLGSPVHARSAPLI